MGMNLSKTMIKKVESMALNSSPVKKQRLEIPLRGLPQKSLSFQMPWPPQTNNYYTVVVNRRWPHGRKLLSKEGKAYQSKVRLTIQRQAVPGHVIGKVRMTILVVPQDLRRFDLDNLLKAMLDSLKKCGIFGDDSQVDDLRIIRRPRKEKRGIHVILRGETPTDLFRNLQ